MSSKRTSFRPTVEALEDRTVPTNLLVVGVDAGPPQVKVFDAANNLEVASFFAFDPSGSSGVRVGTGDVNGDRVPDYICGSGADGRVIIVDGTKANQVQPNGQIAASALLADFFAYEGTRPGLFVTAGNLDGDRQAEVAVSANGRVRVFDIAGGRVSQMAGPLGDFTPYGASFLGGVTLATGDLDGDGDKELVTGTFRGASHIKAFDAVTGAAVRDLTAFGNSVDGVNVAVADINGDGRGDILAGSALGGRGRVTVFSGDGRGQHRGQLFNHKTMGQHFQGGVRIAGTQAIPGQEARILTAPSPGTGSEIVITSAATGRRVGGFQPFGAGFNGGFFLASISTFDV